MSWKRRMMQQLECCERTLDPSFIFNKHCFPCPPFSWQRSPRESGCQHNVGPAEKMACRLVGSWGWDPCSFLSQPRIRITVQMATHSRSNAVPILQGDNELTDTLLHRPRLLMSFSFLIAAEPKCCALRVGVLRACGPHQKRPCMSPRPPRRDQIQMHSRGAGLSVVSLRVSCSCNSIEVSCQSPFISSDTARESCRLMTSLVFGRVLSPDKSPVAGPKCRRPGRM